MTLIFLLNLYCDSLLCGMQQAVCCVWTQGRCRGPAAQDERPVTAPGSQALCKASEQSQVGRWLLPAMWIKASGNPGQRGIGRCGKWDGRAASTWARKLLPGTDWIPVLTWMGPNHKEMNRHRVNILFSKLGSAVVWRVRRMIYYLQEFGQPLA